MDKKYNFAVPDIMRYKRQNFPEAIFCSGKTPEQVIHIIDKLLKSGSPVIATRADYSLYRKVKNKFKNAKYHKIAHMITIISNKNRINKKEQISKSYICVVTAGTSDIPVAEEAAITCEILGNRVERIYDIGIAGLHRVEQNKEKLQNASCIIVCAGMEGALPGVIGGLVSVPVIGVPTSVGYGASFNGLAPLLTMLNSCIANLCCVNIDDGYGAGIIAHLINNKRNL